MTEIEEWEHFSYSKLLSLTPAILSCMSRSKTPIVIYGGGKTKVERERGYLTSIEKDGNLFVVKIQVSAQNKKKRATNNEEIKRDKIFLRNERTRFSLGLPITA